MPLKASDLADKMLSATDNKTDGTAAMDALGQAITDYLTKEAKVDFTWVGVGPPPASAPDPMTQCKGPTQGIMVKLTQCKSAEPSVAQLALGLDIVKGMASAMYSLPADQGFAGSPGPLASAPTLATLQVKIDKPKREDAFKQLAGLIIDWFTALVPTAPCAGTHAAFTGTGTPTAVE